MNTKNLTVLALVAVVVLTGALIVSISREGEVDVDQREQATVTPRQPEGTLTGSAAQTSVEVVSDNVKTSVQVQ